MIVRILASVASTIAAPLVGGLAYRKVRQRRVAKALMIGIPNGIVEERIVRIDPPRSFAPLGHEMIAGVYVDLPQPPGPGVDELVRHAGRHHNDLPARRLDNVLAGGEGRAALLHHKDLLVGVPVQPRAAPRRRVYDDDRDAGAQEAALELAGLFPARRVSYVQDARHASPPADGSASGGGASRNGGTIASSHSARSITPLPGGIKWAVPGITTSWCPEKPDRSPIAPPPSSRNISTACSRRMTSASPTTIMVGASIPLTSSAGQAKGVMSRRLSFSTSVGKSSGLGASSW